jgi:hypothetical protein
VTLTRLLYYIDGNFSIQGGATATGTGVTFMLRAGMDADQRRLVRKLHSTYDRHPLVSLFGDRTTSNGNNNFSGGSSVSITGAIYYATQKVS